jgi:hypothetical protein
MGIKNYMKNFLNKKIKFLILLMIISICSIATTAKASTEVYFQNSTMEISKGDTFSVNLKISSSDKVVNVVDGTLNYDKEKLSIAKVKTDNSLFSLWTQKPKINNEIGELSFTGGIPNGFKGKDGQILEIVFLAKGEGSTTIGFKDIFSVFINDGKGTRINPWLKPMSLSINKEPELTLSQNLWQKNISNRWPQILVVLFVFIVIILSKYKRNVK